MGSYRYRSLIEGLVEALYTLNSPPVVSFNMEPAIVLDCCLAVLSSDTPDHWACAHRLLSSSFLGLPCRVLNTADDRNPALPH